MPKDTMKDFMANVKRFLHGERAPRPERPLPPMPCRLCGEPGMHPVGRGEWVCEADYPPFLREKAAQIGMRHVGLAVGWTFDQLRRDQELKAAELFGEPS